MAVLLFESASESRDSEYLPRLFSLGAFSEARVITGSCLGCSCLSGKVDVGVEDAAKKALALLRVMTSEMLLPAARTVLFFTVGAGMV